MDKLPPPLPPAWEHKIWTDPVIAAALPCRYCLGAEEVATINDEAGTMVSAPCPACTSSP